MVPPRCHMVEALRIQMMAGPPALGVYCSPHCKAAHIHGRRRVHHPWNGAEGALHNYVHHLLTRFIKFYCNWQAIVNVPTIRKSPDLLWAGDRVAVVAEFRVWKSRSCCNSGTVMFTLSDRAYLIFNADLCHDST